MAENGLNAIFENSTESFEDSTEESRVSRVRRNSESYLRTRVDPSFKQKSLFKYGLSDCSIEDLEDVNKVLVLNTGGTIGMKMNDDGVYVPLDNNSFVPELKKLSIFHDSSRRYKLPKESLVLPTHNGRPIVYSIYEYDPLLDSCNMTMDDWKMLAKDISQSYYQFDGFVILHGTDTMAYTASALAFILENLGKPVILTGSQIPIFEPRSDGRDNFLGALIIAGQYCVPEVCLYFNDTLLRGCRSTKIDSESFAAFDSPNHSPLATIGVQIKIHWNEIFMPYSIEKFGISTNLCHNVGVLRLFPSISAQTVHLFLQPPMQGVVIQSYGAGNGPSARSDLVREFRKASDRGLIMVNITQCSHGAVKLSYETGAALADAGIIAGADMTPEAALTKLSYVLGKDISIEEKKALMSKNLRGELRTNRKETLVLSSHSLIERVAQVMDKSSAEDVATIRDVLYPSMMCDAAKKGNVTSLEELLKSGGAVTQCSDYDGRTPLHVAVSAGRVNTVKFLLENGALVHVRDLFGDTPLMNAIHFGFEEITKLLLQTGSHLAIPRIKLGSKLYLAALEERVDQLHCWRLAGADFNTGNQEGRTAAHAAASIGSMDVAQFLLTLNDLDLSLKDNQGHTAVDVAEKSGHVTVLNSFREKLMNGDVDHSIK